MPPSEPAMERPNHVSTPVLDRELLARIGELNRDYLDVLAREHADPGAAAQLQYFPERVARALVGLSSSGRRVLAAAPFALYSLSFENDRFWRAACEGDGSGVEHRYGQHAAAWLQGPFCEAALLQAWHAAVCRPLAARIVYGMSDAVVARIAASPPWRLKRVASEHAALLMPRWPTNPSFWPDLVRFAAEADLRRLRTTHLLGWCLTAAELEQPLERPRGGGATLLASALKARTTSRADAVRPP